MGAPLYDAERRTLSMALVGDAMIARALSPHQEPAFLALAELLQSTDVTFANLETTVREAHEGWSNFTQGTPMSTAPELLEELRWMGVDVVSLANNHTTDNPGNQTREQGRAGRQRNAETKWQCNKEHHNTGGNVFPEGIS
jgi:hypothetical protein